MFSVTGSGAKSITHCGVLEFVAEEGSAFLPSWVRRLHANFVQRQHAHHGHSDTPVTELTQMMRTLLLREGDRAVIRSATLPPVRALPDTLISRRAATS